MSAARSRPISSKEFAVAQIPLRRIGLSTAGLIWYFVYMKIIPDRRLFWFLKEGIHLDIGEPSVLDMYVQQIITRGSAKEIKTLLKTVDLRQLTEALGRIRNFLPNEVRRFWEDFIGDNK